MNTDLVSVTLSDRQFEQISSRVYQICGINLKEGKQGLVKSRLVRRLRALSLDSFEAYLRCVADDPGELSMMIDELTTNKTSFFREDAHFNYLRKQIIPRLTASRGDVRIWSAGCSSGKEAYSIAMLLREDMPEIELRRVRILASDLSSKILTVARAGVYGAEVKTEVPGPLLKKYFTATDEAGEAGYRINENIRSMVRLARLNLMDKWVMKGPFVAIFCRNVMIYFDKPTQEKLVRRFWELLAPGGHLFIGHSESLTNIAGELRYLQPAVYVK